MIITVISSVWALSNKAKKNSSQRFSQENAVLWATSFAFGYAGSVSIISNGLLGSTMNPIQTLGLGHLITATSMLILYRIGMESKSKQEIAENG